MHKRTVLLALAACVSALGCSPADWAAVQAAGQVGKVAACAICQSGAPVQVQAAEHAGALRRIAESVAALAAQNDPAEVERIRAELAANERRSRALTERLVELAAPRVAK